jgi:hypothetical protein
MATEPPYHRNRLRLILTLLQYKHNIKTYQVSKYDTTAPHHNFALIWNQQKNQDKASVKLYQRLLLKVTDSGLVLLKDSVK